MMLLKSVRNCERPHSTFADPAATNQHNSGGSRRPPQKPQTGHIWWEKEGQKRREGGREWTRVAFQQAEMRWRWRRGGKEAERRGASLLTRTMAIWLAAE